MIQRFQEESHPANFDYRNGSPHLKHWHLYSALIAKLRHVLKTTSDQGINANLLDVGAGEGSFIEPALSSGYSVMALEMSRPAIQILQERYGTNPAFRVELDMDGSLGVVGDEKFGVILYSSVLHHIPDYLAAVENAVIHHLDCGGSLVCFQDPLLYSSAPRFTRKVSQIAYYWWRIAQGNLIHGLQTTKRRFQGIYDETNPSDMSEYHAVRNGVDQELLASNLSGRFDDVSLFTYWSTQSGLWQWIGERLGLTNTFGIIASGYRG